MKFGREIFITIKSTNFFQIISEYMLYYKFVFLRIIEPEDIGLGELQVLIG